MVFWKCNFVEGNRTVTRNALGVQLVEGNRGKNIQHQEQVSTCLYPRAPNVRSGGPHILTDCKQEVTGLGKDRFWLSEWCNSYCLFWSAFIVLLLALIMWTWPPEPSLWMIYWDVNCVRQRTQLNLYCAAPPGSPCMGAFPLAKPGESPCTKSQWGEASIQIQLSHCLTNSNENKNQLQSSMGFPSCYTNKTMQHQQQQRPK